MTTRRDGRRERWREHRRARRAELIQAVVTAVEQFGPGVSMDEIAASSGIAKPVFYRYFSDKSDLFRAVGETVAEQVVAETTAAIDREDDPRAKLSAGIDAYLASIEANPDLYRFVVRHSEVAPAGGGDPLVGYASVVGLHAARVIGELMRAAGADSGPADLWGFGIVGLVRAAADRWLEQPSMSREAVVSYLTELLWPGLSGTRSAGTPGFVDATAPEPARSRR